MKYVRFVAVDVEWFVSTPPPSDATATASRRARVIEAIDEVRRAHKRPVIYTRNGQRHWADITGCPTDGEEPECAALYRLLRDPKNPVPLWDVQIGEPELGNFQPHSAWASRAGRQYALDRNVFGLPPHRTVDLNVFDASLFRESLAVSQR